MTKEAPRYILDCMVKATVPVFFTLVTAYTEISTVLAVLWSNIVAFAIYKRKIIILSIAIIDNNSVTVKKRSWGQMDWKPRFANQ